MCTDLPDSVGQNFLGLCGYSMSKQAAQKCLRESRVAVKDIDVLEVHDCFAPNEVYSIHTHIHTHIHWSCKASFTKAGVKLDHNKFLEGNHVNVNHVNVRERFHSLGF